MRRFRNLLRMVLVGAAALGLGARFASADVHIEDLKVGFGVAAAGADGNYKVGEWAPARVRVRAEKEGFDGVLELSTADSDDVQTHFHHPVHLAANETVDFRTFLKPGKMTSDIAVRLMDQAGKTQDKRVFEPSSSDFLAPSPQSVALIVGLGHPAGLDVNDIAKRPGYPRDSFRVAYLDSARELPTRWFGYEAVDHLVVCTDNPVLFENMDVAAQAALEAWVRHGGHLVLSVGAAWQRVAASFLGPLVPAEFDGSESLTELRDLETYLGSAAPLHITAALSVPHFVRLRGRLLVGSSDRPLAIQGPYGLGSVTVLGFDVNREPFSSWDARTDFWLKLLAIRKRPAQANQNAGGWNQSAWNDFSSHLREQLEHFEGISLVPFQWVAFFIFIYIVLIGPVDYWLVKKVFRRMELTWVTFPIMVIVVSVVAYFAAYWIKGDKLRINKVDVVDVDRESGTLRGTSWMALFSPQIRNYSVGLEPEFAALSRPDRPVVSPAVTLSWLGLPESGIGGMGRQGGVGLFRKGYSFGPDARTLIDVPVQVWSMKDFQGRWHGWASQSADAELRSMGTELYGTVRNPLGVPLEECVLVFGRWIYPLGTVSPGGTESVETHNREDLRGHLGRRAAAYAGQPNAALRGSAMARGDEFRPEDVLFLMMFHQRLLEAGEYPANDYFADLDLSPQLDYSRAILVARVAASGSKLVLNEQTVEQAVNGRTLLRVIFPVTMGGPAPRFERPR